MNRTLWRAILISAVLAATLASAADAPPVGFVPLVAPVVEHGSRAGGPVRATLFRVAL